MEVLDKVVALQNILFDRRKEGKTIGLVPTMGALHDGHAALVRRCVKDNDITVVSVFLNPTQFNDKADLERYPRNLDADCQLLEACGADIVFAPSVEVMYPTEDKRQFRFPPVTEVMEGEHRPGHFNGVCQVVSRLFYIVRPHAAYFGEKDWQQIAVVKRLVEHLALDIQIVECEVVRDADGLAKSSRNALLTTDERRIAPNIYRVLKESIDYAKQHSVAETRQWVIDQIDAVEGLHVEYYSIVDDATLLNVASWDAAKSISGCAAVLCGATPIRLIDHITYKN